MHTISLCSQINRWWIFKKCKHIWRVFFLYQFEDTCISVHAMNYRRWFTLFYSSGRTETFTDLVHHIQLSIRTWRGTRQSRNPTGDQGDGVFRQRAWGRAEWAVCVSRVSRASRASRVGGHCQYKGLGYN